jgi:hypothetical protein
MLVTPSDHVIPDMPTSPVTVESAAERAARGHQVTSGIKPTGPRPAMAIWNLPRAPMPRPAPPIMCLFGSEDKDLDHVAGEVHAR